MVACCTSQLEAKFFVGSVLYLRLGAQIFLVGSVLLPSIARKRVHRFTHGSHMKLVLKNSAE